MKFPAKIDDNVIESNMSTISDPLKGWAKIFRDPDLLALEWPEAPSHNQFTNIGFDFNHVADCFARMAESNAAPLFLSKDDLILDLTAGPTNEFMKSLYNRGFRNVFGINSDSSLAHHTEHNGKKIAKRITVRQYSISKKNKVRVLHSANALPEYSGGAREYPHSPSSKILVAKGALLLSEEEDAIWIFREDKRTRAYHDFHDSLGEFRFEEQNLACNTSGHEIWLRPGKESHKEGGVNMKNGIGTCVLEEPVLSKDASTKITIAEDLKARLLDHFCDRNVLTIGGIEDQHKHPFCTYVTKRKNDVDVHRRIGIGQYYVMKMQDGFKNKLRFWASIHAGAARQNIVINLDLDRLTVEYKSEVVQRS